MTTTPKIDSTLMLAFRKAKADLYYSSNPRIIDLFEYEEKLKNNLNALQSALRREDRDWFISDKFVGSYTVSPNSINSTSTGPQRQEEIINFSSLSDNSSSSPDIETCAVFRLMEKASIDFHVLSALWIMLVGTALDLELDDNVYANRLRRTTSKQFNEMSLGSFSPYYSGYRKWQDLGFAEIEKILDSDTDAIAFMTDIEGYFHNLDPKFLDELDVSSKLEKLEELSTGDDHLFFNPLFVHEAFKIALCKWNAKVSNALGVTSVGLPVGLPASGLIANIALIEFDRYIRSEVKPRYYGRYVDDIFMVLEHDEEFKTPATVWAWLEARIPILSTDLENTDTEAKPANPILKVHDTELKFADSKTKITKIGGSKGKQVLTSIKEAIRKNSSEWNFLPDISDDPDDISNQITMTIDEQGYHVETLSKAKSLSTIRSKFAILIRNFEALARDVNPESWKPLRTKFYETIQDQIFNPSKFFELEKYFARILKLAIQCQDWKDAGKLIYGLVQVHDQVSQNFTVEIKSITTDKDLGSEVVGAWFNQIQEIVNVSLNSFPQQPPEDAISSLTFKNSQDRKTIKNLFIDGLNFRVKFKDLFQFDLAAIPFKVLFAPPQIEHYCVPNEKFFGSTIDVDQFDLSRFKSQLIELTKVLVEDTERHESSVAWNANGLFFATRPISLMEIFLWTNVVHSPPSTRANLSEILLITRGYTAKNWLKNETKDLTNPNQCNYPPDEKFESDWIPSTFSLKNNHIPSENGRVRIAIGSLKTDSSSIQLSARGTPDRSLKRYKQITALINYVLRANETLPQYLLLPEVSIPASWFYRIATKLMHKNISLIAGVEFLRISDHDVRNQIWMSLVHSELGFESIAIYRQDKQRPAAHEESYLWDLDRIQLVPENKGGDTPPVITHGDFKFSALICSELTNTKYRANLRGKIDALMVVENNKDLNTFNSLVEATSLDIHCYVAQANNREYGDSRIRAPHKVDYKRDIVRIRGGLNDHFVVGEIDIHALRRFQSKHRDPKGDFKPLPDGFADDMDKHRRMAP